MTCNRTVPLALIAALLLGSTLSSIQAADKALKVNARVSTPPPAAEPSVIEIPQSEFEIPASPREGRNPFFPTSMTEAPAPVMKPTKTGPDATAILLNGLTPGRNAMVNGKTFEKNETGEIKLPNGERVTIKCVEIGQDSATIVLGTQRMELRLRRGL